jgi:hypothetical protein
MWIKTLLPLFLCLFSLTSYAQEKELYEILTKPHDFGGRYHDSSIPSAIASTPKTQLSDKTTDDSHKDEKSMSVKKGKKLSAKSVRARTETSAVSIIKNGGYLFHVADYPDGTRVVTCLDGSGKGYQGMSVNGVAGGGSNDVKWHSKYHFVHKYPCGQVKSYENKQIIEIY